MIFFTGCPSLESSNETFSAGLPSKKILPFKIKAAVWASPFFCEKERECIKKKKMKIKNANGGFECFINIGYSLILNQLPRQIRYPFLTYPHPVDRKTILF